VILIFACFIGNLRMYEAFCCEVYEAKKIHLPDICFGWYHDNVRKD
jgi:hypothetical protein